MVRTRRFIGARVTLALDAPRAWCQGDVIETKGTNQMSIHFDNRTAAVAHLVANGWHELKTGRWVSRDGSCAGHILTKVGDVVLVQMWLID